MLEIHFELENRCLLRCKHCSSNACVQGASKEYHLEDIITFLTRFSEEKTVFFTGGEPLLHRDCETILHTLHQAVPRLSLGLFTSGIVERYGTLCSVSPEHARRLAECGLALCYVSIYGPEEEHDWMTSVEGSFRLTRTSIENLRQCGIEIRFHTVVTKRNQDKFPAIMELARNWGVSEIRLLNLVNHGRAKQCWSEIGISSKAYANVVNQALNTNCPLRITASSCTHLLPCRPMPGAQGCQAGIKLFYVTFQGDVFPCACVKNCAEQTIGNIHSPAALAPYFDAHSLCRSSALCTKPVP